MSWMDSWSRPTKSQATPPPLYLTHGDSVPYCHTCGRVIGARRTNSSKTAATAVKYCSDRCKRAKPSTTPESLEKRVEVALTALLQGQQPPAVLSATAGASEDDVPAKSSPMSLKQKPKKGDPRIIITLSELETAVLGDRKDPEKVFGRRKNRKARFIPDKGEWKSVDMVDRDDSRNDPADSTSEDEGSEEDTVAGVPVKDRVRPPQTESDVNFSVGGERGWAEKIDETPEMLAKRREGQKRAEEKEMVKCAARRAVAFGLLVDAPAEEHGKKRGSKKGHDQGAEESAPQKVTRKCEALVQGQVVEPSFAKGDWSIRWRED
ncbi:hypothetical protein LTR02_006642 [Friedmanniomyces endolithicus]|nr:hypothetical protein LTR59_011423 [Friedmanniomyces endolithicus]KAK0785119.1 hypothetical protein LTR75_013653 [Friedmanniomyces endolithicus]KAK0787961.1 hypothetical protein LTR38_011507 [Friedmanniomyces endolithicus]KAK0839126.1 hypothetical protein LTR03_011521 [Friedmanniomyces endolithicus]KAK0860512.1 hypothetical protein LTS02_008407 [Friedmanniomyces endolithicus]